MSKKRVGLNVGRAVRRIRTDAWDDIWPDALQQTSLPSSRTELNACRRRIGAFRRGSSKIPRAREGLIPKPNGLMRPAHQLTTDARVYYQSLVDSFMYDIDKRLVGKNHVFGYRPLSPRGTKAPFGFGLRQWKRFREQVRREVDSGAYEALVRTDLAAFFERVPHGALEERLTSLGVRDDLAKELRAFLRTTMGRAHGLPQGPDPSGLLASVYLHPLDQAIIGAGYGYVRYVDDIVVLAKTPTDAKKALRLLEAEARRLDLIVQSAKTELVVGRSAIVAAVADDDEIAGVDYAIRFRGRVAGIEAVRKAWRTASRTRPVPRRTVKYLLGRLTDNRDPAAVKWCLARLGELDYLAPTISRYLAVFATRKSVQDAVATHLTSVDNISEWEEMNLIRAMLSASHVGRPLLARARLVAADRNAGREVRQYAFVLLGRHGDPADHDFIARESLDEESLAQAALLALQNADPKTRGRHSADTSTPCPESRALAVKLRSRRVSIWPDFR